MYLFRAVDARGQTVDFRLSPTRDVAAAKAFFRKAFKTTRTGARNRQADIGLTLLNRLARGQFKVPAVERTGQMSHTNRLYDCVT